MKILQNLQQQLGTEFPNLNRTLIKAVVWFVSGGMDNETFEHKRERLLSDMEFSDENEENEFIYDILLTTGREVCESQPLLDRLKSAIQQSATQIKQKKLAEHSASSKFQASAAALNAGSSSSALFDENKRRGKRHQVEESSGQARKKTVQTPGAPKRHN
ncbi:MAG: hypothetical protein ACO1N3_01170 [Gammaproteobacteria bacterium]